MNKIDLEALNTYTHTIDDVNTAIELIRNNAVHSKESHLVFKGIDEYLTTTVMLIEEVIKNERTN